MFRQKVLLVVCALGVAVLAACASATPTSDASGKAMMAAPCPHDPPKDVVIYIDVAADGTATVTPFTAYLDSPAQKIQWISSGPDFEIQFGTPTLGAKPLPPVAYEKGKGRGRLENVPANNHKGDHPYEVKIIKDSGGTAVVDPIIIVTY